MRIFIDYLNFLVFFTDIRGIHVYKTVAIFFYIPLMSKVFSHNRKINLSDITKELSKLVKTTKL